MRADCDETDDADLIEEVLQRIAENGRLVARRKVWINGVAWEPSIWALNHVGPAPELGKHERIDIRNNVVQSGSMCRKCNKLFAEDV